MCAVSLSCYYNKFAGRRLLFREMLQDESDSNPNELKSALQQLEQQGYVTREPAIKSSFWAIRQKCNRCGAGAAYLAKSNCVNCCKQTCVYCIRCLHQVRAKSCEMLYCFQDHRRQAGLPYTSTFPLSPELQSTLEQIQKFILQNCPAIDVVMVAGSGKIPVFTALFQQLLQDQKCIFWCLPDNEIEHTKNQVTLSMPALGKLWEDNAGCLFVAGTKWDLLTYHQTFDVIVLDEVEVEPFFRSCAQKSNGLTLRISASFPEEMQASLVVHPVRSHRYPLPVPKFIHYRRLRHDLKQNKWIEPVHRFTAEVQEQNGQALFIVPTRKDVHLVMDWMKKTMPDIADKSAAFIEEKEDIEELRILFFEQKFTFLIIPAYMASKMQVANLHLCLLFAEHPRLDRRDLVKLTQMVGNNAYFPECEVWFIGQENTNMIIQTKKEHIYLNELAKKEGYLREGA